MEPYIGEIRLVPWKTIPSGWVSCSGQMLQIQQYQALYSLIGTCYGGDGKTTFQLPNLNGRVVMGTNQSGQVGTHAGTANVTLTQANMPLHQHAFQVSTAAGTSNGIAGNICAAVATGQNLYGPMNAPATTALNSGILETSGANAAHTNMQPYTAMSFIICVKNGIYPSHD